MKNYILGTDWWTDCDDAVALRIAARLHNAGKIRINGIGLNACMEYSVRSLEGFLNLEGVKNIPIGIDLAADDFGGNPPYQRKLAAYSERYHANTEAENAVKLYRRLLANSDSPIEIIEIGYLQVISAVLESQHDEISVKNGVELIREKVSKIWVMAGKWDEPGGIENNFARNLRSRKAGKIFCEKCPVPVTFLGWEIGSDVLTGGKLNSNDHLYTVLKDHGSENGRMSWDPMLLVMAFTGDEQTAGYDFVKGYASVDAENGANHFLPNENGPHRYVIKKMPNEYYRDQIDTLIQ